MGTLKPLTLFDPAFDVPFVFKGLAIRLASGANALETADAVKAKVESCRATSPRA